MCLCGRVLADALTTLKHDVKYCSVCHNISDTDICPICSDHRRDSSQICVVENIRDVMAIENTMQYHGLYHVLGGLISPLDGVGPSDIEIASLGERVAAGGVTEVILALQLGYFSSATISVLAEGFATFISQGGQMRLIINQIVSKEDKETREQIQCTVLQEYERKLQKNVSAVDNSSDLPF